MDGFTISNSNKFLNTGQFLESSAVSESKLNKVDINNKSLETSNGKSFAETLKEAVTQVNDLQQVSNKAAQNLATGRTDNIAEVMIAAEKADIALRTMVQVRNKILDAYSEIMKMQV